MRREPLLGGDSPSKAEQIATLTTSLSRIANALGVPVLSFREPNSAHGSQASIADRGTAALLALVEAHLRRSEPKQRACFVERLQALLAAEQR